MYLVRNGNAQWYCNKDEIDRFTNDGYEVYEIVEKPVNEAAEAAKKVGDTVSAPDVIKTPASLELK